ncbi:hypothetical protein MPH_13400 [Macrophomina phaseolina MS6]|uniref:Uncharacterized protein n=1 Tax=Macrophomina phaseolina (strain MS6) TaxID=1126212 RepID=K2RYS3_MACPH|nr:hypothetical protein MPH_13400 [Macrophomina phaseolina MS6]
MLVAPGKWCEEYMLQEQATSNASIYTSQQPRSIPYNKTTIAPQYKLVWDVATNPGFPVPSRRRESSPGRVYTLKTFSTPLKHSENFSTTAETYIPNIEPSQPHSHTDESLTFWRRHINRSAVKFTTAVHGTTAICVELFKQHQHTGHYDRKHRGQRYIHQTSSPGCTHLHPLQHFASRPIGLEPHHVRPNGCFEPYRAPA